MAEYIVLKKENNVSIKDLEGYEYFIVHAISEFRIYTREEFLVKYTNFDEIINLYCFNKDEELRCNNRNWVRIFKTRQENGYENAFEIQVEERKDFSPIEEGKAIGSKIVVYKYFLKPEAVTSKSAEKEIVYLKEIPIIYRHGIVD
jgi:hypothetical protein